MKPFLPIKPFYKSNAPRAATPGATNAQLRDTRHPLCTLFPSTTMEHFHAHIMHDILCHPEDGLAACLPQEAGVGLRWPLSTHVLLLAVRLVQLVSRLGAIAPACPSLFLA